MVRPSATDCASCGHVWGCEHRCPHCDAVARAVRGGGEFPWVCSACRGVRLPVRVTRIMGSDPDGSLRELYEHYTKSMCRARSSQRALAAIASVALMAIVALWIGLLRGEESLAARHGAVAFVVVASSVLVATATYHKIRDLRDRAEAGAVEERDEIRRTYRRAAAALLCEEELTDDEIAELVQSTRDVRRTRIAAGVDGRASTSRVSHEDAPVSGVPVSEAPASSAKGAVPRDPSGVGETRDSRS